MTAPLASALYRGNVVHARLRPRKHRLRYRVFAMCIDLDEAGELNAVSPLFGFNRPRVFSFFEKDHGRGTKTGLKAWVADVLAQAGLAADDLRVHLLCYPRIFGYVFNPLSVYFCHSGENNLIAVIYEVCNTFGERHSYVLKIDRGADLPLRHAADKVFYVSPFMPMECTYNFEITPPDQAVVIAIDEHDAQGRLLTAAFSGKHHPFSHQALRSCLVAYPLMTLKVVAGIHIEALQLWLKGLRLQHRTPKGKDHTISIVPNR